MCISSQKHDVFDCRGELTRTALFGNEGMFGPNGNRCLGRRFKTFWPLNRYNTAVPELGLQDPVGILSNRTSEKIGLADEK
jgi:hypothetical protein